MRLVLLGEGMQWRIYAVCAKDDHVCETLQLLENLDDKRARKVLADLREFVPNSTTADWVRMQFSWKLRGTDNVLEYRWPTSKGGTPRVYWFYDKGQVIVCSHGVNKKGDTDQADIDQAEATRNAYLKAKASNKLEIVSFEQFIDEQESDES